VTAYGVDGCKCGWLWIGLTDEAGCARFSHGVVTTIDLFADAIAASDRVFIDIPIGLRDRGTAGRGCDAAARKLLGRRASSIFNAPLRDIIAETDYTAANARSRELSGKGMSKQSFFIMPKICEVDAVMASHPRARDCIVESHPELCFWGVSGGVGLRHGKKTREGFAERLALLEMLRPGIGADVEAVMAAYPRRDVARDDILDAAVLALCANDAVSLRCAPVEPESDATGLPMQIVYGYHEPIE